MKKNAVHISSLFFTSLLGLVWAVQTVAVWIAAFFFVPNDVAAQRKPSDIVADCVAQDPDRIP